MDPPVSIQTQAGFRTASVRGTLPGYGEVWLDEGGVANILSFNKARERWKVRYYSRLDRFQVNLSRGLVFVRSPEGLYYHDAEPALRHHQEQETGGHPATPHGPWCALGLALMRKPDAARAERSDPRSASHGGGRAWSRGTRAPRGGQP